MSECQEFPVEETQICMLLLWVKINFRSKGFEPRLICNFFVPVYDNEYQTQRNNTNQRSLLTLNFLQRNKILKFNFKIDREFAKNSDISQSVERIG